ncbi:MAG: Rho-binding antiterminator [Betaproteobacteria bacterium]|nr:Rho-binding antiterminator [Betaproteobacteria bacterium]
MTQDAISCDLHDFVEVACMYGYQLRLILKNNQIIEGKAIDIVNSPEQQECLVIDSNSRQKIELTRLAKMEVLTPNAKFSEIIFP